MEELSMLLWIFGSFVVVMALRGVFSKLLARFAVDNDYSRELNDILTKDEYKVKGRFE